MPITGTDTLIRDFFVGFIRLHILYHASKEAVYGMSLIRELLRHGYMLSPGTLYPILHRLERSGFLSCEKAVGNGRWRKYYRITEKGSRALSQARRQIAELIHEFSE